MTVSLEGAGVVNGSNEWKCAGRVGRARYSSRFAHRMLSPPRLADENEELGAGTRREGNAQCVVRMSEGPEADAHVRVSKDRRNGESVMGMIRGAFAVSRCGTS